MNILQSTFEKHKKLMLENLGVINEAELYHATTKDRAENIKVNGPDLSLSGKNFGGAGKDQGGGFYFYKDKKRALSHAADYNGEVIMVFDQNISSDVFDIDYEGDYNLAGKYLQDNAEFLEKNKDKLGIYLLKKDQTGKLVSVGVKMGSGIGAIPLQDTDVSVGMANKMAFIFQNIEKIDKSKFDAFENAFLKISNILKYNGEKKIYPIRIEDLQGNVIWKAENK